MSLLSKLKTIFNREPEPEYRPPADIPRPTSLAERKKKGMDVGGDSSLLDRETKARLRHTPQQSDDPYATAAWEIDAASGRRRLKRTNIAKVAKKSPNNPYDTSSDLDPWQRKD